MNNRRVLKVVITVLLLLVCFISCNSEVNKKSNTTSVSFAPAVGKAINQSGQASVLVEDVNAYHWKVYCSQKEYSNINEIASRDWRDFDDQTTTDTGLGMIKNLEKGTKYYFALRGYTSDADGNFTKLAWQGCHYGETYSTTKIPTAIRMTQKTQVVRIDVEGVGSGSVLYYIDAPVVSESHFTTNSDGWTVDEVYSDRFEISWNEIGSEVTEKMTAVAKLTTDGNLFRYDTATEPLPQILDSGVYFFTITQYTYDGHIKGEPHYSEVYQRKQVLIVNVVAGVSTLISGSLDSTTKLSFEYFANAMDVRFHLGDATKVKNMTVFVSDTDGKQTQVLNNSRILVTDTDYVTISWTTYTNIRLYVNSQLVDPDTEEGGYYVRTDGDATYINNLTEFSFRAYGKHGDDYMISVRDGNDGDNNNQSVSFTIVGIEKNGDV